LARLVHTQLPLCLLRHAPAALSCHCSTPCRAKDPSGEDINALEQHIKNLLCASTPDFFNTLYDPYAPGSDFVRGYPFSMREGKPTAVSHGLWLNIPVRHALKSLCI
jgi:hypothetical protein